MWRLSAILLAATVTLAAQSPQYRVGRPPTPDEIRGLGSAIAPDGNGLPQGAGTVAAGREVFAAKCSRCHGPTGEGDVGARLVGGQGTLSTSRPLKTVGSFWPYATTLWDYVNRAMPFDHPGGLEPKEVYAAVAYVLNLNGIIEADQVMDAATLPKVKMPNRDGFVADPRPDVRTEHRSGAAQGTPASREPFEKRVVTTGLADPFQVIWGPDGYLWVTERTAGRVTRVLPSDGSKTPAITIGDLLADGPGGLLGMALDPGLLKGTGNDHVYLAYTYDADAGPATVTRMKIVRFTYDPRAHVLGNARDILAGLPAGTDHQGGRVVIGPDRKLYVTIGDLGANQLANFCHPNRSQSLPTIAQVQARDWSLYEGKVLRLNLDGSVPPDNPTIAGVKSHIYSYGHRNPQGLVFAPDGKLYESEHGPNTDDEVNLIRAGRNYGWPHVAGYRDDQSYAYANWSASKGVPCQSLTFTAYPAVPPSVPIEKESAWSHPDFTPPIQTFHTVPTGYNFKNPKCAERELYYQCWPTVAPSSLAVYTAKNGIPGWDHSLLMPSLKHGTVYRIQLDAAGTAVVGEPDENEHFKTVNRYRDVTLQPDGLALFIATDVGGNTQDASGRPAATVENPGAILEFRYLPGRSR